MIDFLIKNGQIFCGDGGLPFMSNIGIKGDRIVYVGEDDIDAKRIIDAEGLIVCPGFIDTHGHSEFTLLADRGAEGKVSQGITTEINGNCGLSAAPLYGEAFQRRETELKKLGIKKRWSTFREYFNLLKSKGIGINFATLCGHGNIRASVIGYRNIISEKDILRMKELLVDALKDGVIGLSTGLQYPPGVYSSTEEIIELAKVLNKYGSGRGYVYTSHIRDEGDYLIESIEEAIRIGKNGNIPLHISHLKTSGIENWKKIDKVIELIEQGRADGIRITADRYPYTASSTDLDILLPSWMYEGGNEELLKRIKNPEIKGEIKKDLDKKDENYWKGIVISTVNENKWMEGMSIYEISQRLNKGPVDTFFEIIIKEKNRVEAIFFFMSEENLKRFLKLPYLTIGSDSSARGFSGITSLGKPHPRGFGSFPRFIGKYVREEGLIPLSEAIRKITHLPALIFGIKERGLIKEGFYADICIFDYDLIIDRATYSEPFRRPEGIFYVFVNGILVIDEGKYKGSLAGRVLN